MTLSPDALRELRSLTVKLHEGQLTDEECLRLKTQLTASAESRRVFSAYAAMVALLEVELPTMKDTGDDFLTEEVADSKGQSLETFEHNDDGELAGLPPQHAGLLFSTFQNTVGFFSQEIPFAILVATVITSLGLWGASLVYVSAPEQVTQGRRPSIPTAVSPPEREHVGCVISMVGVKWGTQNRGNDQSPAVSKSYPDAEMRNGRLPVVLGDKFALVSGLMEISYDTGAKVILQGPCLYEVDSGDGGYLSVGKLTARLEKKGPEKVASGRSVVASGQWPVASGTNPKSQIAKSQISNPQSLIPNPSSSLAPAFVVRTPTATVTDLGTEFGVEVQPSGLTSTYVFQGMIEMRSNAKGSSPVRLTAQEAGQVEGNNDVAGSTIVRRAKNIDPASFVRSEQLRKQVYAVESDRRMTSFQRWQTYSQNLRRDPSLVAYYDFQRQEDRPTVLANVAERTSGGRDGVVKGATWCDGRMPGKKALKFRLPTDCVQVDLPQKLDDLTLAAWLSFETLETGNRISGLLMSGDMRLHWQVGNWDGHLCLYTVDRDSAEGWQVVQPYQYHQWMHLVCAYDHATGNVAFFCNGRYAGARTWAASGPIVIGPAWIGGWKHEARNFQGRMDELAIFSRALSHQEIAQMYKSSKP